MKPFVFLGFSLLMISCTNSQEKIKQVVEPSVFRDAIEFLASDELLGRDTGSDGIRKAADYLSNEFNQLGLEYAPGLTSYRQEIAFYKRPKVNKASIQLSSGIRVTESDLFARSGYSAELNAPLWVSSDYDESQKENYSGKIIVRNGANLQAGVMNVLVNSDAQKQLFEKAGALAYIELLPTGFQWKNYFGYFGSQITTQEIPNTIPHICVVLSDSEFKKVKNRSIAEFKVEIQQIEPLSDANIAAFLPGTDPKLKDEVILVTAHYDHVGYKKGAKADEDSIFNGARDNAVGTVALLAGAKALKRLDPKRSVLFLALTGEEKGLLGSKYYAENPLIPLNKTVFNLNLDGAGYNDTSIVTFVGLDYYKQDSLLIKPLEEMGLRYHPDPDPKLNLFLRSDNISFSNKGVPSATYSLGFTAFDDTINKYYHQPGDETDDLDWAYIERFYEGFANVLFTLTNTSERIQFKEDKEPFYEAYQKLYSN
jgi:hypothetical protein